MCVCVCVFPLHSSSLLKDKLRLRISNFKAVECKSCTLWSKVLTEFHGLVQWYTGHPTLPTGHVRVDVGLEPVCPLPQLLDRYTKLALRTVVDQSLASLRVVVHHAREVSHKVSSLSGKTKKIHVKSICFRHNLWFLLFRLLMPWKGQSALGTLCDFDCSGFWCHEKVILL